ncbi:MAG: tryptophanase [Archaeoglobus sp.]|nr:tryptophanase [Archaeoglobus sp.]
MDFNKIGLSSLSDFPDLPTPPPYKIKMVEFTEIPPIEERRKILKEAGYNVFNIPSEKIYIDLLTDSGTSAMSDQQWSALMRGDEAYASARSFFRLKEVIHEVMGYEYVIPTHQGRAAEYLTFNALDLKKGDFAVSNQFFDTTRANVEVRGAKAVDLVVEEAYDLKRELPFKGNIDIEKLESFVSENEGKVKIIVLTVTNNSGGGQPVSMENIRQISEIARENNIPFFLDAARFAENVYFIKNRERGYGDRDLKEIAREMFSLADGVLVSGKKDGLVNIGGFIALNDKELYWKIRQLMVVTEGFPTYGGLAGRDLEALAQGLREVLNEHYLRSRIEQVAFLGKLLEKQGVPLLKPFGGHGIYLDGLSFASHLPREQWPSHATACAIYEYSAIRTVEIGSLMFAEKKDGEWIWPKLDLIRLAIPRRVYTLDHIFYIANSIGELYRNRHEIKGLRMTFEPPVLRHFNALFEPIE